MNDSARIFFEKDLEDHAGDANRRAALGRAYAYWVASRMQFVLEKEQ